MKHVNAVDSGVSASGALFARAKAVSPGGVNSPVRAFGAVGGTPRFMVSGKGPYLVDADNKQYVDLVGSWGPMLLGHAHPQILDAVHEVVSRGTSFGTPSEPEVALAEEIVRRTPAEKLRLVSSGTEATMSAIRLARGFTHRDLVIKFSGCYHGHVDALLAEAGSGVITLGLPETPGIPAEVAADTIVLPFNDRDAVEKAFATYGDRIACLITEAAAGNMGTVPPLPGFNAFLSRICQDHGALFISDEVMTGFRVSRQGHWGLDGAQEEWKPDLITFGKVMGGGFPAAAFGGRADVMDQLAPTGPIYQAGTLSGNPVATTAGLATLRLATEDVYDNLLQIAGTLRDLISSALDAEGVPHRIQGAGSLFSVFWGVTDPVVDFAGAQAQETYRYRAFFHAMLDAGVYLPPSAFESWFISAAHDDDALNVIAEALKPAAKAAANARPETQANQ